METAWTRAVKLLRKRDFEEAYRVILAEGDDVYLLRLVAQTGPVVRFLNDETAYSVLSRVNKIVRSGALQALMVEWVDEASRQGLLNKMDREE